MQKSLGNEKALFEADKKYVRSILLSSSDEEEFQKPAEKKQTSFYTDSDEDRPSKSKYKSIFDSSDEEEEKKTNKTNKPVKNVPVNNKGNTD